MIDEICKRVGSGRAIAVTAVLAAAAIGLAATMVLAGAIGDERPLVEPIVIDTSGRAESDDPVDLRPGASDGSDGVGRDDGRPGGSVGPGASVDDRASIGRDDPSSSDTTVVGSVSTVPPPQPVAAAPPTRRPGGDGDDGDDGDDDDSAGGDDPADDGNEGDDDGDGARDSNPGGDEDEDDE